MIDARLPGGASLFVVHYDTPILIEISCFEIETIKKQRRHSRQSYNQKQNMSRQDTMDRMKEAYHLSEGIPQLPEKDPYESSVSGWQEMSPICPCA